MEITAIIAEYNPFHNGHAHQLRQVCRTGSLAVVVMSPDFVQRGEPALFDKRVRTRAALRCGADLVLELPLPYAMATAQRFAWGAVGLLQAMGCVDRLCFGSECGTLEPLERTARHLNSPLLEEPLGRRLAEGRTFAQARQLAVEELWGPQEACLLSQPNNTLGIEYLLQLRHRGCGIRPHTIPRESVDHHSPHPSGSFASATLLRRLCREQGVEALAPYVPPQAMEEYRSAAQAGRGPAFLAAGERAMLGALRQRLPQLEGGELSLPDLSEGIEGRLARAIRQATGLEELLFLVKTKRYPLARVRRLVLSAYLGIPAGLSFRQPPYLRVLGCSPQGQAILRRMKESALLPVSHSLARLERLPLPAGEAVRPFSQLEARSADLYPLFAPRLLPCGRDYREKAVFLREGELR